MPTSPNLRSRVDAFVADLTVLVRQAALAAVQEALGAAAPAKRGPGRPRAAAAAAPARKAKRAKRDPQAVLDVAARIHAAIKAKPGMSVEEIGRALRMPTKALKLPIIKLLEGNAVTTKGQKRGTRYFAAGAAPKATVRAKAAAPAPAAKGPNAAMAERMAKMRAARDATRETRK